MNAMPLPSDTFARRLRQERERRGITQAQLADRIAELLGIHLDPTAVTRIEKQERAVRLDEAVAAAKALGLPLAALLEEDMVQRNGQEIQQRLIELTEAQQVWERQRQEIQRLTVLIQTLSAEVRAVYQLDPRLQAAIDDRPRDDDRMNSRDDRKG